MNAGDDAMVPDHLVCGMCLDAPPGRVEQCPRGHMLCAHPAEAGGEGSCLAQLRAHAAGLNAAPLCPTCRCPLPAELQRSLVAEQAIARLHAEVPVLRRPLTKDLRHPTRQRPVGSRGPCGGRAWQIVLASRHVIDTQFDSSSMELNGILSMTRRTISARPYAAVFAALIILTTTTTTTSTTSTITATAATATTSTTTWAGACVLGSLVARLGAGTARQTASCPAGAAPDAGCAGAAEGSGWAGRVAAAAHHAASEPLRFSTHFDSMAKHEALCLALDLRVVWSSRVYGLGSVVEWLIIWGADVNLACWSDGSTPLFIATQAGHLHVVERLIVTPGVDVNMARTTDGVTPLFIASRLGRLDLVERLIAAPGLDVNKAHTSGATPLYIAAQEGHVHVVERLIAVPGLDLNEACMAHDATPLCVAAWFGHVKVVERLVAAGADANTALKTDGTTPLFLASQQGHVHVVERLLAAPGLKVNMGHRDGAGPLDIALVRGHAVVAQKLRAAGATRG